MSDFYEDERVNETDLAAPVEHDPTLQITMTGYDAERFQDAVVARVAHDQAQHIQDSLRRAIEERVRALVDDAMKTQISEHVAKILDEGFQPTSQYGYANGPKKSVSDLIVETLTSKDNYNRGISLPSIVSDQVRRNFDKEIEAATARMREMVDVQMRDKLNAAFNAALGIK